MRLLALLAFPMALLAQGPLVVISVDGLDHRYLRDADALGLKIPNMRKLAREGEWADGVIGVFTTVTWPSHTTLVTGKRPDQHGIRGNRRPREEGGDYYWTADLLRTRTLWHAARDVNIKTAAITWPVTVDAAIDFNLPEAFSKRKGGWMDLATIRGKATPGLVEKIIAFDKSFNQEWMDDRTRALATVYLLRKERVNLILLHFVDHDAVAHEHGPFTPEAHEELERTDRYIGDIIRAAPKGFSICLTSDHGFERIDRMINVAAIPEARAAAGLLLANSPAAAKVEGVGREVPKEEVARFAPFLSGFDAAYEPAPHHQFTFDLSREDLYLPPREKGNHGQWPLRENYRSTFVLWGPGIRAAQTPEMDMLDIASRLANVLGMRLN
jgi:hypothetical protein